jgi:hypothetical protein
MFTQFRKKLYWHLQDRVPDGQIVPKWLIVARLTLLPIDTIKLLIMDQYYDIMTDTWKINGVKLSGRMINIITAEVDAGRCHRFTRQGDLVTVESVLSDIENESKNPWKAAVIDYLVCAFLLNKENSKNPKQALHDIVSWEVELALDPRVSQRAYRLLQSTPEEYQND